MIQRTLPGSIHLPGSVCLRHLGEKRDNGFFSYGYRLLEQEETVENIHLASLLDIGLMKLDALIGRGSRKDFYDLYFVTRQIPFSDLMRAGERKYPQVRDFPLMALEGLLQFDNAERDLPPEMLADLPWEKVRRFFLLNRVKSWDQIGSKNNLKFALSHRKGLSVYCSDREALMLYSV
jgi:hypothetical protein